MGRPDQCITLVSTLVLIAFYTIKMRLVAWTYFISAAQQSEVNKFIEP